MRRGEGHRMEQAFNRARAEHAREIETLEQMYRARIAELLSQLRTLHEECGL